jgi:hypothetical protein
MKRRGGGPRSSSGAVRSGTEIAMNKPSLAALSSAILMAGMSAASAGPAMSRDNANGPAAKMQSDKTQTDKTQTDKTQTDKTQTDKTQSANAAGQSGDTLTLSDAQRKMAWQDLYMDSLNQNTPPGFDAVVGAKVPNTIVIAPVTTQAGSDVPALKPYSFAMVQKKLVIVNPSSRKIANVIAQ